MARVNAEISKLKADGNNEATLRNYNSQRNILLIDADFLIHENEEIKTAIDCSLMANTFDALGDFAKAEKYWKESISRSGNKLMKHINERDHAVFLFERNRKEDARTQFERALKIKPDGDDYELQVIAETYLDWAKMEHDLGDQKEFKRLVRMASDTCDKIKGRERRSVVSAMIAAVAEKKE
jgi:tetratricopeptide (TPR) repeat protein